MEKELTPEEQKLADELSKSNNCSCPDGCANCSSTCGSPWQPDNIAGPQETN